MAAEARTNAKFRYAQVMLDELQRYSQRGSGDDFERSHQEAFLSHLFGARDAFLQELNEYYACGLANADVSVDQLQQWVRKNNKPIPELDQILSLGNDRNSHLYRIKKWRHIITHRAEIQRTFDVGGPTDRRVRFEDPETGTPISMDVLDEFAAATTELKTAIATLRRDAKHRNGIR